MIICRNVNKTITFCFDHMADVKKNVPWPNLVELPAYDQRNDELEQTRAKWSTTPPWVDYPRIIEYLNDAGVDYSIFQTRVAPVGSLYLVNICWFSHETDYLALMSLEARQRLQQREIQLVFIYGEADSALAIQQSIFKMCRKHNVNPIDIHVILGNTMSNIVANFHYFDDDEILFQRSQIDCHSNRLSWHDGARSKRMTLLSRVHKSWRAFFCSWYWQHGFHRNSYFSYRMIDQGETMAPDANPLNDQIKLDVGHQQTVKDFLNRAPFYADGLDDQAHNFYGTRVDQHYQDSYWNCVLETHLNLDDNMPGVFITEKTWKAIAHAQPFVILGTAGTLKHLQSQGYITFRHVGIDESYDSIQDPSQRFCAVFDVVKKIHSMGADEISKLNKQVQKIVEHNQQLYWRNKRHKLENLFKAINSPNN